MSRSRPKWGASSSPRSRGPVENLPKIRRSESPKTPKRWFFSVFNGVGPILVLSWTDILGLMSFVGNQEDARSPNPFWGLEVLTEHSWSTQTLMRHNRRDDRGHAGSPEGFYASFRARFLKCMFFAERALKTAPAKPISSLGKRLSQREFESELSEIARISHLSYFLCNVVGRRKCP